MTTTMNAPTLLGAPRIAVRSSSIEEVQAWERLSAWRTEFLTIFAKAAPYMYQVREAFRVLSPSAEIDLDFVSDPDFGEAYLTVVVRYELRGEWDDTSFALRDTALNIWYSAPSDVRNAFPALQEEVRIADDLVAA